jgi:5'(3')-deoxyribonucleotidase
MSIIDRVTTIYNQREIPAHMHVIYVDMDGVLADFDASVAERFFISTAQQKLFPTTKEGSWRIANQPDFFHTLRPISMGMIMLEYLLQNQGSKYVVGILSATGDHHKIVQAQKLDWLENHVGVDAFQGPIIFATSGVQHKKLFATPNSILIDDTEAVTDAFEDAGGRVVRFSPDRYTLLQVQALVESLK